MPRREGPVSSQSNESRAMIDVAVAIIRDSNGNFLLGQRRPGTPYPGFWEFPGGKIECGETAREGLARELDEEIGIRVASADPWLTQIYRYSHATVRLRFFRVRRWHGEIQAREHSALAWQSASNIEVAPVLPANHAVFKALQLPDVYAITPDCRAPEFPRRLDRALRSGLQLLQIRDKRAPPAEFASFAREAVALCHQHGAKAMINGDIALASELAADGAHLPARQLMALKERPPIALCGASCHDLHELERAAELKLDFVVLGAVRPTTSHTSLSLGWQRFSELIADYPLPVYAIGGMRIGDLEMAQSQGAHGLAMIGDVWRNENNPD